MGSPSRPRKRGSEDQLDNQIANSQPENTKRSKTSLECILGPIPASDPKFTGKLPALSNDRALSVHDYEVDLREQQNRKRLVMADKPWREEEEPSDSVAHFCRQHSQVPVNGNTGQGPVTNYPNMFAVPMSTRQEDQGIVLAGYPDPPAVAINRSGPYPAGRVETHPLRDYQIQLMLLEPQNHKILLMPKEAREEQDTALRTLTSLPDQLNIAQTAVKELLENLPAYFRNIEDFKQSMPEDVKTLQVCEVELDRKEAEIKTLENRYNELIEMTPGAQQEALQQVKNQAMLTMQEDREKLKLDRDNAIEKVEGKNKRIAGLEGALGRSRELVPELIEDLMKLAPKIA